MMILQHSTYRQFFRPRTRPNSFEIKLQKWKSGGEREVVRWGDGGEILSLRNKPISKWKISLPEVFTLFLQNRAFQLASLFLALRNFLSSQFSLFLFVLPSISLCSFSFFFCGFQPSSASSTEYAWAVTSSTQSLLRFPIFVFFFVLAFCVLKKNTKLERIFVEPGLKLRKYKFLKTWKMKLKKKKIPRESYENVKIKWVSVSWISKIERKVKM